MSYGLALAYHSSKRGTGDVPVSHRRTWRTETPAISARAVWVRLRRSRQSLSLVGDIGGSLVPVGERLAANNHVPIVSGDDCIVSIVFIWEPVEVPPGCRSRSETAVENPSSVWVEPFFYTDVGAGLGVGCVHGRTIRPPVQAVNTSAQSLPENGDV